MSTITAPAETFTGQPSKPKTELAFTVTERHLALLPPRYQAVTAMRYLGNAKYEEIAKDLQISIGTVRSRLSRVRAHLERVDVRVKAEMEAQAVAESTQRLYCGRCGIKHAREQSSSICCGVAMLVSPPHG